MAVRAQMVGICPDCGAKQDQETSSYVKAFDQFHCPQTASEGRCLLLAADTQNDGKAGYKNSRNKVVL